MSGLTLHRPAYLPRMGLACLAALAAFALLGGSTAEAKKGKKGKGGKGGAGAVYAQTNDPAGNHIVVYRRAADGTITERARVATGGAGAPMTPPFGFPIVDSQGSIELTKNGRLLFAVNAGDDTVSSFRVKGKSLRLVDRKPSGGDLPVSLDSRRKLLYVVNSISGDISGLRFTKRGRMTPIPGSTEALSPAGANSAPAQIGFASKRRVLTVTLRGPQMLNTFRVARDGTPGPAVASPSDSPSPFGFEYQRAGNLIVSNAGQTGNPPDPTNPANFHGSATSYRLAGSGALTPIDHADIPGERATCWVVITKNDKYAFMTNTLSNSVSRFRLTKGGDMTLLGNVAATGPGFASDEALSRNSRYLYVLVPSIMGGASHVDVYRVGSGGTLTHIQATPSNLPPGVSGMAAR